MITVHGRTRTQGFAGATDLDIIRRVREAVPDRVPVVGNGDVVDVESFRRMRESTGCDAVMIGRGAQGNPWLFKRLKAVVNGEPDPGPPSLEERIEVFHRHVSLILELKSGPRVIHEVRKACAWYAKGQRDCNTFRQKVWKILDPDAVIEAADEYFANLLAERSSCAA